MLRAVTSRVTDYLLGEVTQPSESRLSETMSDSKWAVPLLSTQGLIQGVISTSDTSSKKNIMQGTLGGIKEKLAK